MKNKYPGSCSVCGRRVGVGLGETQKLHGSWLVYHQECWSKVSGEMSGAGTPAASKPAAAPSKPTISFERDGDKFRVKAATYLGKDTFGSFRDCVSGAGCKFQPSDKSNLCTFEQGVRLIKLLRDKEFLVDVKQSALSWIEEKSEKITEVVSKTDERLDAIDADLATRGFKLRNYQRIGVQWLSQRAGAMLGDQMGVGKTIQTLASLPDSAPVLVICPKVAKGVWEGEVKKFRPSFRTTSLEGLTSFRWPEPGEILLTHFRILPDPPKKDPKNPKAKVPSPLPDPPEGVVVVVDEAQLTRGTKSRQGQSTHHVCHRALDAKGRAWLLTGTPMVNNPPELKWILSHARLDTEAFGSNYKRFEDLFGAIREDNKWSPSGTSITGWGTPKPEVPELLKRVMLRRELLDVAPEMPSLTIQDIPVTLDEKTEKQIEASLRKRGLSPDEIIEAVRQAIQSGKPRFEEMSEVRAILAKAKTEYMYEQVEQIESEGHPCVVFSAHLFPLHELVEQKRAAGKRWALITGADAADAKVRTQIVEDFQEGRLDGVALTIAAGGTAITLTRATRAVFVDLAWTSTDNDQAYARIFRIGQTSPCIIYRLIAKHPLDARVIELIDAKAKLIKESVSAARIKPGEKVVTILDETSEAIRLAKETAEEARAAAVQAAEAKGYEEAVVLFELRFDNGVNSPPTITISSENQKAAGLIKHAHDPKWELDVGNKLSEVREDVYLRRGENATAKEVMGDLRAAFHNEVAKQALRIQERRKKGDRTLPDIREIAQVDTYAMSKLSVNVWKDQIVPGEKAPEVKHPYDIEGEPIEIDEPEAIDVKDIPKDQRGKWPYVNLRVRVGFGITQTKPYQHLIMTSTDTAGLRDVNAKVTMAVLNQAVRDFLGKQIAGSPVLASPDTATWSQSDRIALITHLHEAFAGAAKDIETEIASGKKIEFKMTVAASIETDESDEPAFEFEAVSPYRSIEAPSRVGIMPRGEARFMPHPARTPLQTWTADALVTLANLDPDRAGEENGVGFNKSDGGMGHRYAQTLRRTGMLTPQDWRVAGALCRKYWRQIGKPPRKTNRDYCDYDKSVERGDVSDADYFERF